MRLMTPFLAGLALCLLAPGTSSAQEVAPQFPKAFSGDVTMKLGDQTMKSKFALLDSMIRTEMDGQGEKVVNIIKPKDGIVLILRPGIKSAMRIKPPQMGRDPLTSLAEGRFDLKRIGPSKVDGVQTMKYETTAGQGQQIYVWLDKDHTPVRISSAGGKVQMDFSNVNLLPPSKDLFEIPKDYQVIDPTKAANQPPKEQAPPSPLTEPAPAE